MSSLGTRVRATAQVLFARGARPKNSAGFLVENRERGQHSLSAEIRCGLDLQLALGPPVDLAGSLRCRKAVEDSPPGSQVFATFQFSHRASGLASVASKAAFDGLRYATSGEAIGPEFQGNPCFGLNAGMPSLVFDGLRCVIGATTRHGGRSANAIGEVKDSGGPHRVWGGEAQPDAGIAVQGPFAAGQTRYFQVIHRDNYLLSCMNGLNTSQVIEVTFQP